MANLFLNQAKQYAATRPVYPLELFEFIASKTPRHDLAWDVGTGSGQAAASLATLYKDVVGTDTSAQQLAYAPPSPTPATSTPRLTSPSRASTRLSLLPAPSTSSPSRRPSTGSTCRASTRRRAPSCARRRTGTASSPPGATPSPASAPPSTRSSGASTTDRSRTGRPTASSSTTSTAASTSPSTPSRGRPTRGPSSSPPSDAWTSTTTSATSPHGPRTRRPRRRASRCSTRPPSRSSLRRGAANARRSRQSGTPSSLGSAR